MGVTALISGGISAAGSLASGYLQSNASSNASAQQVAQQQAALAQQKALYEQGLSTQAGYVSSAQNALNPYAQAGQSVLPTLKGLITPGANQSALLAQTPGFQFAQQYGTMAAQNALSAKTGPSAGPLATAISQYNNGLAQNTWQNTVGALQNYAGLGGNAAGALGNIFGNAGNAALSGGIQAGNSQASTLTGIGQSQAAGTLGQANAWSNALTGTGNGIQNAALFNALGQNNGASGLYSPDSLANGPTTSQANSLVNGSEGQFNQYESLFG